MREIAKPEKKIILNDKKFEIAYKLSCKLPLLLKNNIINKLNKINNFYDRNASIFAWILRKSDCAV